MAITNIYDDRKTRYVDLQHPTVPAAKFTYFFKTNVDATEVTLLKQTEVTALPTGLTAPAIAGTRRPTPLIVKHAQKRITTLCSSSAFGAAQAAGWRRTNQPDFATPRTQNTAPTATDRGSVIVTVPVDSLGSPFLYGWYMQFQQFMKITDAERTAMMINIPTTAADWAGVVLGCNKIKPPRARRTQFSGNGTVVGGSDTVSTFYAVGAALPPGWVHAADFETFAL